MEKREYLLPLVGESALKNADTDYKINNRFSDDILRELHSIYGESLEKALEILDKSKIIRYHTKDCGRTLYVISMGKKRWKLYESINFCICDTFKKDVLESPNVIMCEHVLALKLANITGGVTKEAMNDLHFVELLKIMSESV